MNVSFLFLLDSKADGTSISVEISLVLVSRRSFVEHFAFDFLISIGRNYPFEKL